MEVKIEDIVLNKEVYSKEYGNGKVTNVRDAILVENCADFPLDISFENKDTTILCFLGLKSRTFSFKDEELVDELSEFSADQLLATTLSLEKEKQTKSELLQTQIRERMRAERLAKKAAQNKEIFNQMKSANLTKCKALSEKVFEKPSSIDEETKYLMDNIIKIDASIPDYLEKWFISEFGDVKRKVISTNNINFENGCPALGLGLKLYVELKDEMPKRLKKRIADTDTKSKYIDDSYYIYELIKKYGFSIGKEQNFESIISSVKEGE